MSESDVVAAAATRGVGVYGIEGYFLKRPARPGLILGYPRLREADIREGVRRLAEVL
jgi:GntR family transcriptional regulator/MocR family aminotransferase